MGEEGRTEFDDENDLVSLDEFDGDGDFEDSSEEPSTSAKDTEAEEQRRIEARRKIERRNELKALNSELDEWDDLFDEEDL